MIITQKPIIKERVDKAFKKYDAKNSSAFITEIHTNILQCKVRYPLLEYAGRLMAEKIEWKDQIRICDEIMALHENGCSVITGIILQLRLPKGVNEPIEKAGEYMIEGNEWYHCDNLAERVIGHSLLLFPEKTIPILKKLLQHESKWVVRSVGVATHYATKKGLKKKYAEEVFLLLLSQAHLTDFHTKTGIGWGAKTIVKFHPDIYKKYRSQIEVDSVRPWFKTKLRIGLGRSEKYAGRFD
jgi:hypothetical protein